MKYVNNIVCHKLIRKLKNVYSQTVSFSTQRGFKKYFFNTGWLFVEQVIRLVSSLFVGIWVARFLGPEQFGVFSYVIVFYTIFAGVSKLGLDGIVVKELIVFKEKQNVILGTAFWLKIFSSILSILLILFILFFLNHDSKTNIFILIISIGLLFQSFEVIQFYFQSQVQAKIISICKLVQLSISSLSKIYLITIDADLIWFVLITAFDTVTLAISYFVAYKRKSSISYYYKYFEFKIAFKLLRSSMPMMLSTFLISIYMKTDIFFISYFLGDKSVGIYSAGIRFIQAIYFLPIVIMDSLFPALINSKKHSDDLYYQRLQNSFTLMTWLAISITTVFYILSDFLIINLFGSEFIESSDILKIYSFVLIPLFISIANDKWFYIEDKGYLLTFKIGLGAFLNIILNFVFIPLYGLSAAAIVSVLSFFVSVLLSDIFVVTLHKTLLLKLKAFIPLYLLK